MPGSQPDVSHVTLPDIPSNTYELLSNLSDAIDTASSQFTTHAGKLAHIQGETGSAVSNVTATSQGQAATSLSHTWHLTQTDFNGVGDPLSAIVASNCLGGSPNQLQAALNQHKSDIQTGLIAVENIQMLQRSCPVNPPTQQQVDEWIQQINTLMGALGNVNMALEVMILAIRKMNGGFAASCATGFAAGMTLPTFSQNAFASTSSGPGSSGSGGGYTQLAADLKTAGLSSRKITNIINALKTAGMSDEEISQFYQQLQDSGLSQEQIAKFFSDPKKVTQMPEIWKLYQSAAGVPNIDSVLFDMANGSSTNFSGSLYQLQFIAKYVQDNPDGPFITNVEDIISGQKAADVVLDNGTVIDLKSYDWSKLAQRNYVQTEFGNGVTVEQGIEQQIQRYKDLYPGKTVIYYADSAYGKVPPSVQAIFDKMGVKVQYWPNANP